MPFYRDVKPGDSLRIGETTITVEQKTGSRTRLLIDSPDKVVHDKSTPAPTMRAEVPQARREPPSAPGPIAPQAPRPEAPPARRATLQIPAQFLRRAAAG